MGFWIPDHIRPMVSSTTATSLNNVSIEDPTGRCIPSISSWCFLPDLYVVSYPGVLVGVSSKETEPRGCVYTYREIYFKKLSHSIMEAGKSKLCWVGHQAGDSGKANALVQGQRPNAIYWQNFFLLKGGQSFVLFRPLNDWRSPPT